MAFRTLLKRLITDVDLENNDVTFVDVSMQHAGPKMHAEYGKALSQHQEYTRKHDTHMLMSLSEKSMTNIHGILINTTGVVSIH